MEKLLPRSGPVLPGDAAPLLTEEKGKDSFTKAQQPAYKSALPVEERQSDGAAEGVADTLKGSPATGERLFMFRDTPESGDVPQRKRKRNFLNLKKGSVAPTNLP